MFRKKRIGGRLRNSDGFTMIELMVAMLIIGVLLAIAVPSFLSTIGTAHNNNGEQNLANTLLIAKSVYTSRGGYFPTTAQMINLIQSDIGLKIVADSAVNSDNTVSIETGGGAAGQQMWISMTDYVSHTAQCYYLLDNEANSPAYTNGPGVGIWYDTVINQSQCLPVDSTNPIPSGAPPWSNKTFPPPN